VVHPCVAGPGSGVFPSGTGFWVARAEGSSGPARLSWPIQNGDYRMVLMNADASQALDADVRFALVLPSARGVGVKVLVAGLGITLLGGLLLTLGLRTPRPAGSLPPAGATPPHVPTVKAADGNARR
jgi:hypothetical protein